MLGVEGRSSLITTNQTYAPAHSAERAVYIPAPRQQATGSWVQPAQQLHTTHGVPPTETSLTRRLLPAPAGSAFEEG